MTLEPEALKDALDGLFAYDGGCVSSGIRDEALRARCGEHLRSLPADERRLVLSRLTREMFLSEDALSQGYGAEDAGSFVRWLDDQGWLV